CPLDPAVPERPTTVIFTLSLRDALPISGRRRPRSRGRYARSFPRRCRADGTSRATIGAQRDDGRPRLRERPRPWKRPQFRERPRSEEHTSELQSRENLVCRLLLEKKKMQ